MQAARSFNIYDKVSKKTRKYREKQLMQQENTKINAKAVNPGLSSHLTMHGNLWGKLPICLRLVV